MLRPEYAQQWRRKMGVARSGKMHGPGQVEAVVCPGSCRCLSLQHSFSSKRSCFMSNISAKNVQDRKGSASAKKGGSGLAV